MITDWENLTIKLPWRPLMLPILKAEIAYMHEMEIGMKDIMAQALACRLAIEAGSVNDEDFGALMQKMMFTFGDVHHEAYSQARKKRRRIEGWSDTSDDDEVDEELKQLRFAIGF